MVSSLCGRNVRFAVCSVLTSVAVHVRPSRSELNCDSPVVTFGFLAMSRHLSDYVLCYFRRPGYRASVIQDCSRGCYETPVCKGTLTNARISVLLRV